MNRRRNTILFDRIAEMIKNNSQQGWLVIDRRFDIVFANKAFCQLWKTDTDNPDALVGQSLLDLYYDGEKQKTNGEYQGPLIETMDTGRDFPSFEACFSHAQGENIWYLASTFLLRDRRGRPEYAVGSYVGIDKFKIIEKKLDNMNANIIKAFCKAIGVRDAYTMKHSEQVATLMAGLAEHMKLKPDDVTLAYLAGIVHDVGKIGIPEHILNKPGRLTLDEYEIIKKHPVKGADILAEIDGFHDITTVVKHHHERFDGLGYPFGLTGLDIPLFSRMLSVCDAYEAMTSERCYRCPFTSADAREEIIRCSGTQFDPAVSAHFIDYLDETKDNAATEPVQC